MKTKRIILSLVVVLIGIITANAQDNSGRFFYYTSGSGEVYPTKPEMLLGADGQPVQIISNTCEHGKGVMEFDRPLVTIGSEAFYVCLSFTGDLTIPSAVEKIDSKAFYMCPFTGNLYIPDSVKEIGELAFYDSYYFTGTLRLSNSLTTIGLGAFAGTKFTGNITIPSSLTSIGNYAFSGCTAFSSITIESSTPPTINETVFDGCGLDQKTLCLPSCGLTSIFKAATGWKDFGEISPSHTFEYADAEHEYCTSCHHGFLHYSGTDIVTPHHATHLLGADGLPLTILSNTFQDGKGVIEFDRPLVTIGLNAFEGCENLTKISIPESVEHIEALAFTLCSNLKSVNVRWETPIAVDNTAFLGLSLTDLTLIVPCSQTAAYHAANIWKDFGTYQTTHTYAEDDDTHGVCTVCGHGLFHYQATKLIEPYDPTQLLGADGKALTIVSHTFTDGEGTIEFDRPLVTIGTQAFKYTYPYTGDLVIPYTVTKIGDYAFLGCVSDGALFLPKGLTKLGRGSFIQASFQKGDLIIPDGVTEIPYQAFYYARFNGSLHLPKSLKTIWDMAFEACTFTGDLIIPDQVTSIYSYAFKQCNYITGTIHLPKSLHFIGMVVFPINFNKFIVEWEDPTTITYGGGTVFEGDYSNKTLGVPCTVVSVYKKTDIWKGFGTIEASHHHFADDDDSHGYCLDCNHSFIYYEANAELYKIGTVIDADGKELRPVKEPYEDGHGSFEFNGKIVAVNGPLLSQRGTIYGVTIPNSIVTIGEHTFDGFIVIGNINIPKSLKTIGDYAFRNCSAFNGCNLTIPEGVESIGKHAFEQCHHTFLSLPNTLKCIGDSAFCDCEYLTGSLTIPDSVTEIGEAAFAGGYSFSGELILPNTLTAIKPRTFRKCGFKKNFVIPNSITEIGSEAFLGCKFTGTLTLPNTLNYIGDRAFKECTELTGDLTIPSSITYLGEAAFAKCSGMKGTLNLPENLTEIKAETFRECGFSTNLVIPNSVTKIGYGAFERSGFIGDLNLPTALTEIGDEAFLGDKFIGTLTIPNKVTTIGKLAFQNCEGFTGTLTLANSITAIGDNAFRGCKGIDTVVASWDTPVAITASVFTDANTLKNLTLSLPNCGYRGHYEIANVWKDFGTITPDHVYADETHSCCTACNHGFFHYEADDVVNPYQGIAIRDKDDKWMTAIKNECNDGIGVLEFPHPIVSFNAYAFYGGGFKKVIIPNTVTNVGELSFYCCSKLNEVTIPNSVTNIGGQAFTNCAVTKVNINCNAPVAQDYSEDSNFNVRFGTAVKEINFGEDVKRIGANLCYSFPNLEKVTFCDGLTVIGQSAFKNCSKLQTVNIPKTITTALDKSTFSGCTNLTDVEINSTVVAKQSSLVSPLISLFGGNVENLTFGDDVEAIGTFVGFNNSTLKNVSIGKSATSISDSSFKFCYGLESISVSSENTNYNSKNNCNCLIETSTGTLMRGCKNSFVPSGVKKIATAAFVNVKEMETLRIPNSVEVIEENAFYNCSDLRALFIGNGLKTMGASALAGCSALEGLRVEAYDPPTCTGDIVDEPMYETVYLETLNDSYSTGYATAEIWKKFKNINTTSAEKVDKDESDLVPVAYYDLNGIQYAEPQQGINIVRYNDGTVKKINVK